MLPRTDLTLGNFLSMMRAISRKMKKNKTRKCRQREQIINKCMISNEIKEIKPNNSSTPFSSKISSLHELEAKGSDVSDLNGFKIYEEFDEYEVLTEFTSTGNTHIFPDIKVYEDLEFQCIREDSIFEDVVFLSSLEIGSDDGDLNDNSYEFINMFGKFKSAERNKLRFKPRSLKCGKTHF